MVFHWSLSDSKSTQVSRTLLSILSDIDKADVWMVSTHPLISKSSSPFINPLVTVSSAPITIAIAVTLMFHFFQFFYKVYILISLFVSLQFYTVVSWNGKIHNSVGSLFLLNTTCSGRLVEIEWSVCISKFQRILCVSFSTLCIYHLIVWSNLNFLHNSQLITFPTQSCLVLYSLCVNLLHSLISFRLSHNIIYFSYFVASCLFLLWHRPYGVVLGSLSEKTQFLS